jgi:hypothetical protein
MPKKYLIAGAVAGVLALCCAGALVIGVLMPDTQSSRPTLGLAATSSRQPVLANTPAPGPTDTPVPAPMVTPVTPAPSFEEIRTNHEAMTEAQWKNYRTQIEGTMVIGWHGWIDEVTGKPGHYKVMIDMDSPDEFLSYPEVGFVVPDDVALILAKDQPVTFSGQIETALDMLGALDITLEDAELR